MDQTDFIIEQITTSTPQIAASIRILTQQLGNNAKPLSDDDAKSMIDSSNTYIFVAREKSTNHIVGMITLLVHRIPYVKKGYIEDLIVKREHRKKGLGTGLFEKALGVAKEQKASYVDFTSRPQRAEGNKLYEKLGFKKRETNVYRVTFNYDDK